MNLFLDTLSPKNALIIFNDQKEILCCHFFDVRLHESTLLVEEIDTFLHKNNYSYSDFKNFVVVNGPGSFTGVRTTVLLINTINYIVKGHITSLSYFDLFDEYPIIKASSKKDAFLQLQKGDDIQILDLETLKKAIDDFSMVYSDIIFDGKQTISQPNYKKIIENISFSHDQKATAFYIKKPNIS